jgi:hypothetical protein
MGETPKLGEFDLSDRGALEDAKAFNKGKGRLLFVMIALLLLSVAAFGWYLVQDQPNPYGELGKQVNGLRGQYFDGFWTCALPGKQLAALKNDGDPPARAGGGTLRPAPVEQVPAAHQRAHHAPARAAPAR